MLDNTCNLKTDENAERLIKKVFSGMRKIQLDNLLEIYRCYRKEGKSIKNSFLYTANTFTEVYADFSTIEKD